MSFNEAALDLAIQNMFDAKDPRVKNKIEQIHPQIRFYYNSFNICLGKQGCGKTTFLMKELIKLNETGESLYDRIIYVSNGDVDYTFETLRKLITNIPIYVINYQDITQTLTKYFKTRTDEIHHMFVILEDATFLLMKDSTEWNNWVCKLRHLRMTIWANVHVWRSLNTMIKTQISKVFVFGGYSREQLQQIFRQSAVGTDFKLMWYMYTNRSPDELLEVDNINSNIKLITK